MQVNRFFRRWEHQGRAGLHYWCEGCDEFHGVVVEGAGAWGFNGDHERPTFTPSVLVRSGHFLSPGKRCWCDYNREHPDDPDKFTCKVCHTFIRDGQVQFLADCTHALAGQTRPMVEIPEAHRDAGGAQ